MGLFDRALRSLSGGAGDDNTGDDKTGENASGAEVALVDPAATQVVAAAGAAVVSAARLGRMITRTGWGIARRLPGGEQLHHEAQRLQDAAIGEMRRLLDTSDPAGSPDEQRAVALIQGADRTTGEPLREAMAELLERSVSDTRLAGQDYLYGTIVSQLVPDEARILAALSDGTRFAVVDVVAKAFGRGDARVVLANASSVGRLAGIASLGSVSTYVTRLHGLGLVRLLPESGALSAQYEMLATETEVRAAQQDIDANHRGSPRLVRRTLAMSAFGQQFWGASAPTPP